MDDLLDSARNSRQHVTASGTYFERTIQHVNASKEADICLERQQLELHDNSKPQSIGDAWLAQDASIVMLLRGATDGTHMDAMFTYKTTDKAYNAVLLHLGGLAHGEIKAVPPWKDNQ